MRLICGGDPRRPLRGALKLRLSYIWNPLIIFFSHKPLPDLGGFNSDRDSYRYFAQPLGFLSPLTRYRGSKLPQWNWYLTLGMNSRDPNKFTGYTDLDWGHDFDCCCSISGYVFLLGNSVFSWSSKQQPTVAASATKGEYMSRSHSTCQGLWLCQMLIELGLELEDISTTIFVDNWGTIDLSKDSRYQQHTKHIDIQHHFICKCVENGTFEIIHCLSHLMLADGLTKPLPCNSFSKMVDRLSLISYQGCVLDFLIDILHRQTLLTSLLYCITYLVYFKLWPTICSIDTHYSLSPHGYSDWG